MSHRAMLLHCRCEGDACTCKTPDGEKVKLSGMISAGKYRDGSSTASSDARVALSPIQAAAQSERWSWFLRQPAKVDSPMQRTNHHEDAEKIFG
jgi:hypothetical protein